MVCRSIMVKQTFSTRLLRWFDQHGRKDLPWQQQRTPYRVWVSEIMLQQTQVASAIPYFTRFLLRFPDVHSLANARLDDVLHLWTGLGYYARARNLHHAAQVIRDQYGGEFPQDIAAVEALPGIGRSTAGAILALSTGQRHAILDGNVKRVMARRFAVAGWTGQTAVANLLWAHVEQLTPATRCADYTQAIMDLGATLCTPKNPDCAHCPVRADCEAYRQDAVALYPQPKPRKPLPVRRCTMLMITNPKGEVLLEQRPASGIWGGLWSFPECPPTHWKRWVRNQWPQHAPAAEPWQRVRHTFTHFHLDLQPIHIRIPGTLSLGVAGPARVWYNTALPDVRGLAAPVKRLLEQLQAQQRGV